MNTSTNHDRTAALIAGGHLLRAVLSAEDIRRTLLLASLGDVLALNRDAGLPLAAIAGGYYVSREAFRAWLDARAEQRPQALVAQEAGACDAS